MAGAWRSAACGGPGAGQRHAAPPLRADAQEHVRREPAAVDARLASNADRDRGLNNARSARGRRRRLRDYARGQLDRRGAGHGAEPAPVEFLDNAGLIDVLGVVAWSAGLRPLDPRARIPGRVNDQRAGLVRVRSSPGLVRLPGAPRSPRPGGVRGLPLTRAARDRRRLRRGAWASVLKADRRVDADRDGLGRGPSRAAPSRPDRRARGGFSNSLGVLVRSPALLEPRCGTARLRHPGRMLSGAIHGGLSRSASDSPRRGEPQHYRDVQTLRLGVPTEGDKTGYENKQCFEEAFSHFFGLGSIYPALAEPAGRGWSPVASVEQDKRLAKMALPDAGRLVGRPGSCSLPRRARVRLEFLG